MDLAFIGCCLTTFHASYVLLTCSLYICVFLHEKSPHTSVVNDRVIVQYKSRRTKRIRIQQSRYYDSQGYDYHTEGIKAVPSRSSNVYKGPNNNYVSRSSSMHQTSSSRLFQWG
jgi:hypothetical protein